MIVLIGTGAVATMLAERLFEANLAFRMFGGESARSQVLAQRFGSHVLCGRPEQLPSQAKWIVVTKTWQNAEKVKVLSKASAAEAVLVLQNGLSPDLCWEGLAPGRVERGVSTYGARSSSPGRIVSEGTGLVRLLKGSSFRQPLEKAGFEVEECPDLERLVWHKLAVNASLNVVCTLFGLRNGEILNQRQARNLTRRAADEVRSVALACGVSWGTKAPWGIVCEVASATWTNVCSTLADFRQHRPSEYEDINGAILSLARFHGLEVPTLRTLDQAYSDLLGARPRTRVTSQGVPTLVAELPLLGGHPSPAPSKRATA